MEGIPGGWPAHENPEYQPAPVHNSTTIPQETAVPPGTARKGSPTGDEKSKGLRKLFKRKPVAEQGMLR
jgi:hypothetical protein